MKRKLISTFLSLAFALALAPLNFSQGRSETYAIRNARIVTVTKGVIENGTVVISDGKITAVGANVSVPGNAKVIDARGLSVYPGMIDGGTVMGLTEIGQGALGTVDSAEMGDNNANIRAEIAVHPDSAHIRVTRANGITTVLTAPRGGMIAGQGALINLDGWTPQEMLVKAQVTMQINWPGAGGGGGGFGGGGGQQGNQAEIRRQRDRQIENLKKILGEARAYADAKDAQAKDPSLPRQKMDLRLEGLVPVVRGQMPMMINTQLEDDIKKAISFADEMKIKIIIGGGVDAYKVADQLKAKNIPVVLSSVMRMPAREDDPYDIAYSNAGLLAKAGVKIAFQTQGAAEARDLPYNAGMSAAFGLSKEEALKSVTINPAEIFGVADQLGSIEVGKMANLIVTDGDPLEIRTQIKHMFIRGRQVSLTSRHTELYERYKARP